MAEKIHFIIAVLLILYAPSVFSDKGDLDICPDRSNPIGQSCQKACTQDKDCPRKKQKCMCDGECGMSCITARSSCPWPVTILNAKTTLNQESQNFGDQMTVRCHPGYQMADGQEVAHSRCQGDKKWSVTAPCDEVYACDDPPDIENGYFVKSRHSVRGMTAQYRCSPGFRLIGDDVTDCIENNTWSNATPVCKKIHCPPPPEIKEGILVAVKKADYDVSEVIYYMCKKNFLMDGPHSVTCLPNGHWSEGPACRARCKVPVQRSRFIYKGKKMWVTELEEGLVHHSESVAFSCRNNTQACSYTASTQCFDGVLPLPDCYVEPTWVEYTFFSNNLVSEIASCQGL